MRFSIEPNFDPEDKDKMTEFLRSHRIYKFLMEKAVRARIKLVFAKHGVKFTEEMLYGLIEGAVIANPLLHPGESDGETELGEALPGKWVAYDANRPSVFPADHEKKKLTQVTDGRLAAFLVAHIIDRPSSELTSLGSFDPLDIEHILEFDTYSAAQLVDHGLLEQTTHAEAYQKLGLYPSIAEELELRRMAEDTVYQVTPKGNTLIKLIPDFGKKNTKRTGGSQSRFGSTV